MHTLRINPKGSTANVMATKDITTAQMECFSSKIRSKFPKIAESAQLLAANNALAVIRPRIFNDGQDAEEKSLTYPSPKGKRTGAYSQTHARTRSKAGRQTGHVDLQLSDRLFRSLQVVDRKKGPSLVIKAPRSGKGKVNNQRLAAILEEKYETDIFVLSDDELQKVSNAAEAEIGREFDKIVRGCL